MSTEHDEAQTLSFPVEILAHVFELYIDIEMQGKEEFHDYARFLIAHCSPVILMQVCSRWRAIALATPSLWTFVCPSYDPLPDIRSWLAICPKYPLDLQLSRCYDDPFPRNYTRSVFNLFSREGYRWRSLSIDLDSDVAEDFVNLLQSDDAAPLLLEDLKVDLLSDKHLRVTRSTLESVVGLLPRLKLLRRLLWIDGRGVAPLHEVPWNQLKTVIVTLPSSLEEIFSYLSQCTVATTVELQGETIGQPEKTRWPSGRFQHFSLHNLTSLTLSRGCDPMWLLQHFTMPSLQVLDIGILRRNQDVLEDFVKRSPHLHTLIIGERHAYHSGTPTYADEILISDQEIIDYLTSSCLRSIPRVALNLLHTKQRTIALIQQRSESGRPLPHLLCWNPGFPLMRRFVGWWDHFDERRQTLLFSYTDGSLEFTQWYHEDSSFRF